MQHNNLLSRRHFLRNSAGAAFATLGGSVAAQLIEFKPNVRSPDPAVQILDRSFAKYRIYGSTIEQIATGMLWAEGPVYIPQGNFLLFSDVPKNRIMKYDEADGRVSIFRNKSHYANGNTRDRQNRLVTCEQSETRCITRTEKNGDITTLAATFEGKRFNGPKDIVVKSDDSIWFTDPTFGLNGEWGGTKATPELATTNVFRIGADGKVTAVRTELVNPCGLAFSKDEQKLYVAEGQGTPNVAVGQRTPTRRIWSYDVAADRITLSNKFKLVDATDRGAIDGFRVDLDGNLWCGWGIDGELALTTTDVDGRKVYQLKEKSEQLDGVRVFNSSGDPLAHISLPERCTNLCFGGSAGNRLYMTCCHSVYALDVEAYSAIKQVV